ncbi:MAG TPA: FecR domain-containing protein [Terracidiphilus sp.]|nr:FecR domain-containing protein [Terracidiphilus sp.]
MKRDHQQILDRATRALRADVPDAATISASAARASHSLGIDLETVETFDGAIRNCEDVQRLFAAYRAGSLPSARRLLVEAHLRDCGPCLRIYEEGRERAAVDWSAPSLAGTPKRRPLVFAWGLAGGVAVLLAGFLLYRTYLQVPPGVRAQVQSIDGTAYLIGGNGDRRLAPGAALYEGEELRTAADSFATVRLADGSLVEVNQRSMFGVGARGHNMTVRLNRGAVIVQAAHRTAGHLYVMTPDCRVADTGTVFSVDAGLKGSRVAVLQGSVDVMHAGISSVLHPGEQMATSKNLAPEPLSQQFAWSPDRQKYLGLIAELANVEQRIAKVPFPQPRYGSDLLPRVPAGTLLYVSIPNLGNFLDQANTVFQDQLSQSPELRQWWTNTHNNPEALNQLVGKVRDLSTYLGDEVVMVGFGEGKHPGFAMIADVGRSGFKEELQQQFSDGRLGLVVLDPASLASAPTNVGRGGYALVRDHEVVFANNLATLKLVNAQLDGGASGFAKTPFGTQIAAAYTRGAGIIIAANLQEMIENRRENRAQNPQKERGFESTGLAQVKYLIAEHREVAGVPENHLNLQFAGVRQRIASWLASPSPIGSLDYVSPNASVAVAALTKDPTAIADDILAMASQSKDKSVSWSDIDAKLQISLRDDLMANLSGEFLFSIDGPVLPTPSWKLVIGVNDPAALENALERMTQAINSQMQNPKAHRPKIEPEKAGSRTYYVIHDLTSGAEIAQYTFADGYMIVAPSRAVLMDALHVHASGISLARSADFRALLPRDEYENYSAVFYQNLSPVLTPLLSQVSGEAADAIRQLASDARPTVICAWGKDNRIEAASDSRLFGFDFFTLGAILKSRNKSPAHHVMNGYEHH